MSRVKAAVSFSNTQIDYWNVLRKITFKVMYNIRDKLTNRFLSFNIKYWLPPHCIKVFPLWPEFPLDDVSNVIERFNKYVNFFNIRIKKIGKTTSIAFSEND